MTMLKAKTYTVREAAEEIGVSVAIVRKYCSDGTCPSEYHEFPGTKRGFYLLNEKSMKWLRENVSARPRGGIKADE